MHLLHREQKTTLIAIFFLLGTHSLSTGTCQHGTHRRTTRRALDGTICRDLDCQLTSPHLHLQFHSLLCLNSELSSATETVSQLTGGNTYSLTVEYANGTAINGHASIVAYSGATYNNSGTTFINGITTKLVALSGGGFSYTPTYTPNAFNAPEYGYF